MDNAINKIEIVIHLIKVKLLGQSATRDRFVLYYVLTLEVLIFELRKFGKMTDHTSEAIAQLLGFQAHEFFYWEDRDFYNKISELFYILLEYNKRLKNNELSSVGVSEEEWEEYFNKAIKGLRVGSVNSNF